MREREHEHARARENKRGRKNETEGNAKMVKTVKNIIVKHLYFQPDTLYI